MPPSQFAAAADRIDHMFRRQQKASDRQTVSKCGQRVAAGYGRAAPWLFRVEDAIAAKSSGNGGPAARTCLALSPAAPTFPLELPRASRAR